MSVCILDQMNCFLDSPRSTFSKVRKNHSNVSLSDVETVMSDPTSEGKVIKNNFRFQILILKCK